MGDEVLPSAIPTFPGESAAQLAWDCSTQQYWQGIVLRTGWFLITLLIPRQFVVYRSLRPIFCTGNLGLAGKIGCASSPAHFLVIPVLKHRAGASLGADYKYF